MARGICKLSLFNDNNAQISPIALRGLAPPHRSFIRSDFVTMPVTSPLCVTSTAL